jgi:shikimate kinase
MHVYLTGFMGAGKSSVGRRLAELLGWSFIDMDLMIEAAMGDSVAEIFRQHGEKAFRRQERIVLRNLSDAEPAVVATGGGVMAEPANREWMRQRGLAVWLDVPFPVMVERLKQEESGSRPLFVDESQARDLYQRRLASYRDSDLRIEISSAQSARDVAESIRDMLKERKCVT